MNEKKYIIFEEDDDPKHPKHYDLSHGVYETLDEAIKEADFFHGSLAGNPAVYVADYAAYLDGNYDTLHEAKTRDYRVEYITREEAGSYFNFSYSGQWADENIQADNEKAAIDLIKQHLIDCGEDIRKIEKDYLFRAKEVTA